MKQMGWIAPKWTEMDQSGLSGLNWLKWKKSTNWTETDRSVPKWTKLDRSVLNWSETNQIDLIASHWPHYHFFLMIYSSTFFDILNILTDWRYTFILDTSFFLIIYWTVNIFTIIKKLEEQINKKKWCSQWCGSIGVWQH